MIFRDRIDGGRQLARRLERFRAARTIVLGLPRGGVPVALEVALRLGVELDLVVVRKLAAPQSPEYALGAIAEGGAVYVRRGALAEAGLADEDVLALAEREAAELARRVRAYRGDGVMPDLGGRTALVVDDGAATGATALAAARAARLAGAAQVVLAAPVIAARAAPDLRSELDDLVAVDYPAPFFGVGAWYRDFAPTSDADVLVCLRRGRRPPRVEDEELWEGARGEAGGTSAASPG